MARQSPEGFILITVLIVISLLFPVVLAFFGKGHINLLQAENFRDTIQARRTAQSGVEVGVGMLKSDDPAYDGKSDAWASRVPAIGSATENVEITIIDDDSKININALIDSEGRINSDIRNRLMRLIDRLGGDGNFINAVVDWIDADNIVTEPGGGESHEYRDRGYPVKNAPLDSQDELGLIRGYDKELFEDKGFKKFITVAPTDGKVNVNTAPIEVLEGLGFREGLVQEIARARDIEPFRQIDDIWRVLGIDAKSLPQGINQKIKVNSSVFTIRSICAIKKVTKGAEATVKRDTEGIKVLSWREF